MALPAYTGKITGAYVTTYIAACSAEVQANFAALQISRGVAIANNANSLRTAQIELFLECI